MAALYITSTENGSGKTAICAGIGKILAGNGKQAGYFKPVISDGARTSSESDGDAGFMKNALGLDGSVDTLSPVISSRGSLSGSLKETCEKASPGKDVVIVEGIAEQNWADSEIAEALGARVILVEDYSHGLKKAMEHAADLGNALLGIIVNKVPKNKLGQVKEEATAAGAKIIGLLPEDRTLMAMSVGELAESIKGEMLRGQDKAGGLVENVMLGALTPDHGPYYFGRKDNKAVVLKSDRPDMQMAAMETSTSCMVLTGGGSINANVMAQAEARNIPIITTGDDPATVAATIEESLPGLRFHQEAKIDRAAELLERNLDVPALISGLN